MRMNTSQSLFGEGLRPRRPIDRRSLPTYFIRETGSQRVLQVRRPLPHKPASVPYPVTFG